MKTKTKQTTPTTENKKISVDVKPLKKMVITFLIKGESPYLAERMPFEVAENIDKKKSNQIVEKDTRPESAKIEEKIHYTQDGKVGIPTIAFYKGMIEVAPYMDLYKKTVAGAIRVVGEITPIRYSKRTINKAVGRSSGMVQAPRLIIRPQFNEWECFLTITFDANTLSPEQVVNLINYAGWYDGVGGWRPQCTGFYGQYKAEVYTPKKTGVKKR